MAEQNYINHILLETRLARSNEEIEKAFKLRYEVFVQEEKANSVNAEAIEKDCYDIYCDHLIVLRKDTEEVIGTYRLMTGKQALMGIGFYSETEFDLSGFRQWFPYTVELGRSCVKKEFRSGRTINLLWNGIGRYIQEHDLKFLIGCASIHANSCTDISKIYSFLKKNYFVNGTNIQPLRNFEIEGLTETDTELDPKEYFRKLPPLIKGYLRLGAYVCSKPAYDPVFGTFDFFMILNRENLVKRYHDNYLQVI